jgi:quercetin dioxygenase-like cupin family protein
MEPKSSVNSLNKLVKYQKDSIVSKVLIKKQTGNVTLFAFEKGQELSEHTAPFDALVHVFEGQVDVILNGKSNITKSREMIIMPANVPHALKAVERFKMMLVMIKS